jgi:tetratricopeptide (TPR) repeat protein
LKAMAGRWENAICVVSGFVSGALLGFNGYMWSQSVIVEVYSFGVLSLMGVLLCLLRWIYAPHQRRYVYLALFLFGICFTNHQSLLVAAIGIEVAIAAAQPKLGRDLFLGNSVVYILGLIGKQQHIITSFDANPPIFVIFNAVGLCSIVACVWLAIKTQKLGTEWKPVLIMGILWLVGAGFYLYMPLAGMSNPPIQWGYPRTVEGFVHALTRGQYERARPTDVFHDPLGFITQLGMMLEGVVDEFNLVYAFIALVPFLFFVRMQKRERAWLIGITAIYLCLGVLLLILLNPPPDRQARELCRVFFTASHVLVAMMVGYGLTLIAAYMATHYERFRRWGLLGGTVAIALALYSLTTSTSRTFFGESGGVSLSELLHYIGLAFAKDQYGLPVYASLILLGMTVLFVAGLLLYRRRAPLAIALAMFAIMPAHSILSHWFENEQHGHLFGYWFGHDMFTPPFPGPDGKLTYDPNLRAELMKDPGKAKLIYPEMTRDTVLFGGTDPGRFCPTYTIFCESFIPPKCKPNDPNYDRRDVYIITQNALADGTYLCYIRAHYNRSAQKDPPFFQELFRSRKEIEENYTTNLLALAVSPLDRFFTGLGDSIEKRRRVGTSYFTEKDFTNFAGFAAKLRKPDPADPLSKYLFDNLTKETQSLLSGTGEEKRLRRSLAKDLNRLLERELEVKKLLAAKQEQREALDGELSSGGPERKRRQRDRLQQEIDTLTKIGPLYDADRFKGVKLSESTIQFIRENPRNHTRIRLNRLLLEEAYPREIAKSKGGVYPDREINIPTPEDSSKCFQEYLRDAERRLRHDAEFPNEYKQVKLGEDVKIVTDGNQQRVQVSGQVAVMSINGLLTKVIFDKNPDNEFFVEESFPLDWMYPYLTPFGIIMKINRQPLSEITEDIVKRDHEFWSRYSERFIGNWITYDTPVKDIAEFAEKTYLRHDFSGFKGDRKFVRDDQAQKAFSKLRSSIAGVYAWRLGPQCPAEYRPKTNAEYQRILKETDFAFRQAFAFCPYSPEAVFRYAQLLINLQRYDDALLIASTCQKLDPYSGQVAGLVKSLTEAKQHQPALNQAQMTLQQMESDYRARPTDFQAAFNLAGVYMQMQRTNDAIQILDQVLDHPQVEINAVLFIARAYAGMGNFPKLEAALDKLVKVAPTQPEAWYDLAAMRATLGKRPEAVAALRRVLELNAQRLNLNPQATNLLAVVTNDPRFSALRQTPEFQELIAPK